jgi:hypothetical protein
LNQIGNGEPWEGNRKLDRLLDGQLTFREKLEWMEEAETLSLRLRANRERQSGRRRSHRTRGNSKAQPSQPRIT